MPAYMHLEWHMVDTMDAGGVDSLHCLPHGSAFTASSAQCRCLAVKSERIINNSVARLRPHHAAALLEGAVERLRTRARRGTELTTWIRAVLTHHTAYLMAAPGVLPILATLSQVLHS